MVNRWRQIDHRSGIYVVGCGQAVKIGWSAHIGRRLRQLEEVLPEYLMLYRIFQDRPMQDEGRLHRHFKRYRRKGEWFALEGDLKAFVGEAGIPEAAMPGTYAEVSKLLKAVAEPLPPFPPEPAGPPTLYQRYLDLVASGGGILCFGE